MGSAIFASFWAVTTNFRNLDWTLNLIEHRHASGVHPTEADHLVAELQVLKWNEDDLAAKIFGQLKKMSQNDFQNKQIFSTSNRHLCRAAVEQWFTGRASWVRIPGQPGLFQHNSCWALGYFYLNEYWNA